MIDLRCPRCRRDLSLPDGVAGKTIRCAHCREIIQVLAPVRPPRETRLRNAPNAAMDVPVVRPVETTPPPREIADLPPRRRGSAILALFVVGCVGLLLLAAIGLIGAGVWFYMDSSGNPPASSSAIASNDETPEIEPVGNANSNELSVQTLTRLKRMTVFIKSDFGFAKSSGTGFLVRVEDRTGYIVTNDHVARGNPLADEEDIPGARAKRGSRLIPRSTTVVFDSGTPQERSVVAQIVAHDDARDLAILKVSDVADLPKPINLSSTPELRETLQVYVLGFPLGRLLGGGRNPAITVGKGSISSLRYYDHSNRLSRVQVQGDINPGNSGGPVVDARGRLVGVAVASVDGTQIGLAIPPQDVLDLLHRKDYRLNVAASSFNRDEADVEFQIELLDLFEGVKEVKVLYLIGQALPPEAMQATNGRYAMLQNARELMLTLDRGKYTGRIKVRTGDLVQNQLPYQVVYTTGRGQILCNSPQKFNVQFGGVAVTPPMNRNPTPPPKTNANPNPNPTPPPVQPSPPPEPPITPAPPWVPPETSVTFEAPMTQVAVGGAGRFLIVHMASVHKLAIFDITQKKFVKTLTVDDDQVMFAAGKSLLILALPKSGVFERWNLNTLQREAEVPSPGISGIKALAMGNASDELLLTFVPGGSSNMGMQLIDPKTFRSSPYQIDPIPGQPFGLIYSPEFACVSMSANAETIVVHGQFTWSSLVRDGKKYHAYTFGADMPLPSPDGKLIIGHGQALSNEGKAITQKRGGQGKAVWCIPAVQGNYYLSFNQVSLAGSPTYLKVMVHKGSDVEPVVTLPKNDSMTDLIDWFWGKPKSLERHVFLLPDLKVLALITPKNDRIDLYPVSIPK